MIQLPKELAKKHLQTSCCKGDVLFWKNFPIGITGRDSFFVLMTGCIDNQFLCARTTRKTYHYVGPTAKRLAHDIILIKRGETTIFPVDTVIDLTWMRRFTTEQLSKLLGSDIEKRGKLPDNIIKRVDVYVRAAVTISPRDIKLILGA